MSGVTLPPVSGVSCQNNSYVNPQKGNSGVQPVNFGNGVDSFTRTSAVTAPSNQENKSDMKKWLLLAGLGLAGIATAIICKKKMDLSKAAKAAGFDDVSTYKKLLNDFPDTTIKKYKSLSNDDLFDFLEKLGNTENTDEITQYVVMNKNSSKSAKNMGKNIDNLSDNALFLCAIGSDKKVKKVGVIVYDNLDLDSKILDALKKDGLCEISLS